MNLLERACHAFAESLAREITSVQPMSGAPMLDLIRAAEEREQWLKEHPEEALRLEAELRARYPHCDRCHLGMPASPKDTP